MVFFNIRSLDNKKFQKIITKPANKPVFLCPPIIRTLLTFMLKFTLSRNCCDKRFLPTLVIL